MKENRAGFYRWQIKYYEQFSRISDENPAKKRQVGSSQFLTKLIFPIQLIWSRKLGRITVIESGIHEMILYIQPDRGLIRISKSGDDFFEPDLNTIAGNITAGFCRANYFNFRPVYIYRCSISFFKNED